MQPDVDLVNIVQIHELASASGVDLSWLLPINKPNTNGSKKYTLANMAQVISEQIGTVTTPNAKHYTAVDGQVEFPDTDLNGADYDIYKWGVGPLEKGIHWQNDIVGGGWRLLGMAAVQDEKYIAVYKPKVSNILAAPGAIARFTAGVKFFPASGTISAGDYRKLIVATGAEIITLPPIASYPANVALFISTLEGPRMETTIKTTSGDLIANGTTGIDTVYLGKREFITFIHDGSAWYVQGCSDRVFKYPEIGQGWMWDATLFNVLPAVGGTYLRSDLPSVWAFVQKLSAFNSAAVKTGAVWATNRTYWGTGNGTTTFNVPDLRGVFMRNLDQGIGYDIDRNTAGIGSLSGSLEPQSFQSHTHSWSTRTSNDSLGGSAYVASSNGPVGTGYESLNSLIDATGGTETRPVNVGVYPLIYI